MKLKEALEWYRDNCPAFKSKPVGAPGSPERLKQDNHIAAENAIKLMISYLDLPDSGYVG